MNKFIVQTTMFLYTLKYLLIYFAHVVVIKGGSCNGTHLEVSKDLTIVLFVFFLSSTMIVLETELSSSDLPASPYIYSATSPCPVLFYNDSSESLDIMAVHIRFLREIW